MDCVNVCRPESESLMGFCGILTGAVVDGSLSWAKGCRGSKIVVVAAAAWLSLPFSLLHNG